MPFFISSGTMPKPAWWNLMTVSPFSSRKSVLHVVGDSVKHHQRAGELKQRGPLDRLHCAPAVAIAVAKVAEPAAARPGFKLEGHPFAVHFSKPGPSCSRSAAKVASIGALTRVSSSILNERLSISGSVLSKAATNLHLKGGLKIKVFVGGEDLQNKTWTKVVRETTKMNV